MRIGYTCPQLDPVASHVPSRKSRGVASSIGTILANTIRNIFPPGAVAYCASVIMFQISSTQLDCYIVSPSALITKHQIQKRTGTSVGPLILL